MPEMDVVQYLVGWLLIIVCSSLAGYFVSRRDDPQNFLLAAAMIIFAICGALAMARMRVHVGEIATVIFTCIFLGLLDRRLDFRRSPSTATHSEIPQTPPPHQPEAKLTGSPMDPYSK